VEKVLFEAGDMVHKGDLLVELDPIDEQRTVDNAKAEVSRMESSLGLAKSDADKVSRDWPMQVETALAGLEAARAAVQGAVVNFKKLDAIRKGTDPQEAKIEFVSPNNVKPIPLKPENNPKVQFVALQIALSEAELRAVHKLVQYGKEVANSPKDNTTWVGLAPSEFQDGLIALWQVMAKQLASTAELRNAVNTYVYVEQSQTKVKLAEVAMEQSHLALAQANQRLKETKVYAPNDGQVEEVYIREGQIISSGITTVTGGTPLLKLADVSKLYVVADVDEADIGRVRELAPVEKSARLAFAELLKQSGINLSEKKSSAQTQPELTKENIEEMEMLRTSNNVEVTVDAFREQMFTGKVDRVYPNPKNVNNIVTYNVRILLTSENRRELMVGMHANVKFTSRKLKNILQAPIEAIKVKNEEHGVYIKGEDGKPLFVPTPVGLTNSVMIELKTNKLKEGEEVYTKLPTPKDGKPEDQND
jgi:multidrug efflux pump subunit AcrA (membrane-fusion protein)